MKKVGRIALSFILIILGISFFYLYQISENKIESARRNEVVSLNEIEQLVLREDLPKEARENIQEKIGVLKGELLNEGKTSSVSKGREIVVLLSLTCIAFTIIVFLYVYRDILRPFYKMEGYADSIARGNFDVSLDYEKSNYFGRFTWAFDHMRREIVKARACEIEAIQNNKTVIATLSHDIKTPIASIRAYAEGIFYNLYEDDEARERYIEVILRKCDEVTKLTNDIFLHSLSDLDKLKMNFENIDIKEFLEGLEEDMKRTGVEFMVAKPIPREVLKIDKNRINQALENIVNNSKKYGKPPIELSCNSYLDKYEIVIRDYGSGIKDEDMPFVLQKFYRGRDVLNKEGAGLGLYIVSYIMKQHNGSVSLRNMEKGLEATLTFQIEKLS